MNRVIIWVAAAFAAATLMLTIAWCAGVSGDAWGVYQVETKHYTIDGITVRCLLVRTHKGTASLSCDWDHPIKGG